jgi:hypothetical protein
VIDQIGTMTAGGRELRVRLEVQEFPEKPDWDEPSEDEMQAWRDGEVYGWILEERVTWAQVDPPVVGENVEMETWEHLDSCWGYYGRAWAEQSAREALESFVRADLAERTAPA